MAAVFTLAVSTSGRRAGSLPRLLALLKYASGPLLLLPALPRWAQLLFPLWVMTISVHVLLRSAQRRDAHPAQGRETGDSGYGIERHA